MAQSNRSKKKPSALTKQQGRHIEQALKRLQKSFYKMTLDHGFVGMDFVQNEFTIRITAKGKI